MDFYEFGSLEAVNSMAPWTEPLAARLLLAMLNIIRIARQRGVLFKDIKPQNLIFSGQAILASMFLLPIDHTVRCLF
jgi:hypothetical protein